MALVTKQKRKPPIAHKKRVGQHHKQSQTYAKHYWPYLPMLLIVGMGLFVNSAWSNHAVLGAHSDYSATALLNATNSNRADAKEQALVLDHQLTTAAQAKANDLASKNYWAHNAPDGKTPWDLITTTGYQYQTAGENLAYGFTDAGSTETGWMNSVDHKANILNSDYTQVGFATASSPNYLGKGPATIVVAEYAAPVAAAANITFTVPNPVQSGAVAGIHTARADLPAQTVSRVQLITGGHATWSLFAVSLIASTALCVFILRHGLRLQKVIIKGEQFVAHHAYLDITIVAIFTAGFILTRTSGIIR
jgi:uncharacterized protein YkwD